MFNIHNPPFVGNAGVDTSEFHTTSSTCQSVGAQPPHDKRGDLKTENHITCLRPPDWICTATEHQYSDLEVWLG